MGCSIIKVLLYALVTLGSCALGVMVKRATVPHNCHPGYVISSLTYWGQDFSLSSPQLQDINKFFTVLKNGDVVTSADVSKLLGQKIPLIIQSVLGSKSWTDSLHVDVQNGHNVLTFAHHEYEGKVHENQPIGSIVSGLEDVFAEIRNLKRTVSYSMDSAAFELNDIPEKENHVQIVTSESLDREKKEKYLFTLKAWTNKKDDEPAYTKIRVKVVDENDNVPHFQSTEEFVSIKENTAPRDVVFTALADDPDTGKLHYSLDPASDKFMVDSLSGEIMLNAHTTLQPQTYVLNVYAEDDAGQRSEPPCKVSVIVEADETLLRFQPHQNTTLHSRTKREVRPLKEREIPEIYTGNLLTLESSPNDRFAIKEPCPENLEIHPITGTVRVRDRTKLDYEKTKEIDFIVVITKTNDETCK